MQWVLKLEKIIDDKVASRLTVARLKFPDFINTSADIGLRLDDAKRILSCTQSVIVTDQFADFATQRRQCADCGLICRLKDYRPRTFDTVFGQVNVKRARFSCPHCGLQPQVKLERATPEFDFIRVKLAAHMPYRVAGDVLRMLTPAQAGVGPSTIRNRVETVAEQMDHGAEQRSVCDSGDFEYASALTLGLDHGFIRSNKPELTRHHHVLVGTVSSSSTRQVFAGVQADTPESVHNLIRIKLHECGYSVDTDLTVLTDGELGLSELCRETTDSDNVPILDWFHIAMRLQHLKQYAAGLSRRVKTHREAQIAIQEELEKLHWRLWNGRTDSVEKSIAKLSSSIRRFRHYMKPHQKLRESHRKLWVMLVELKRYIRNNDSRVVDYNKRQRAGQPISTALVESSVNSLVNMRMNKRRQMRWSAAGADRLLRVRFALINGELSGTSSITNEQSAVRLSPEPLRMAV